MNRTTRWVVAVVISAFFLASPGIIIQPADAETGAFDTPFGDYATAADYATTADRWFIKFSGVFGESTVAGHKDWTEARGVEWSLDQPEGSVRVVSPVTVAMDYDAASIPILKACDDDTVFSQVLVDMMVPSDGLKRHTKYRMRDVTCESYNISGNPGSGPPALFVLLDYTRMTVTYYLYDATGKPAGTRAHEIDARTTN